MSIVCSADNVEDVGSVPDGICDNKLDSVGNAGTVDNVAVCDVVDFVVIVLFSLFVERSAEVVSLKEAAEDVVVSQTSGMVALVPAGKHCIISNELLTAKTQRTL